MARFLVYDRVVDSGLDLPGAIRLPDGPTPADLRIDLRPAAPSPPDAALYQLDGEALTFSPPGVATYRITDTDLTITPTRRAEAADLAGLLIATALPAWAWRRGRFVLHAAGVLLPGATRVVAIAGASGSGKSTVLAHLLARGARMVGDDTLAIDCAHAAPRASGLAGGYFRRLDDGVARAFEPVSAADSVCSAPLGAVVVLTRGDAAARVEWVAPLAAVSLLLANRHRPAVPRVLGREAAVLGQCTALATSVPVYRWHRMAGVATLGDEEFAALRGVTHA